MPAKRQLAELVHDAVSLEGIHFTLPEIQTLLDGVTVGGRKLADQQVVLNQARPGEPYSHLLIKNGKVSVFL